MKSLKELVKMENLKELMEEEPSLKPFKNFLVGNNSAKDVDSYIKLCQELVTYGVHTNKYDVFLEDGFSRATKDFKNFLQPKKYVTDDDCGIILDGYSKLNDDDKLATKQLYNSVLRNSILAPFIRFTDGRISFIDKLEEMIMFINGEQLAEVYRKADKDVKSKFCDYWTVSFRLYTYLSLLPSKGKFEMVLKYKDLLNDITDNKIISYLVDKLNISKTSCTKLMLIENDIKNLLIGSYYTLHEWYSVDGTNFILNKTLKNFKDGVLSIRGEFITILLKYFEDELLNYIGNNLCDVFLETLKGCNENDSSPTIDDYFLELVLSYLAYSLSGVNDERAYIYIKDNVIYIDLNNYISLKYKGHKEIL